MSTQGYAVALSACLPAMTDPNELLAQMDAFQAELNMGMIRRCKVVHKY